MMRTYIKSYQCDDRLSVERRHAIEGAFDALESSAVTAARFVGSHDARRCATASRALIASFGVRRERPLQFTDADIERTIREVMARHASRQTPPG